MPVVLVKVGLLEVARCKKKSLFFCVLLSSTGFVRNITKDGIEQNNINKLCLPMFSITRKVAA